MSCPQPGCGVPSSGECAYCPAHCQCATFYAKYRRSELAFMKLFLPHMIQAERERIADGAEGDGDVTMHATGGFIPA